MIACTTNSEGIVSQQEIKQVVRKAMMDAIIVLEHSVNSSAIMLGPPAKLYPDET